LKGVPFKRALAKSVSDLAKANNIIYICPSAKADGN